MYLLTIMAITSPEMDYNPYDTEKQGLISKFLGRGKFNNEPVIGAPRKTTFIIQFIANEPGTTIYIQESLYT